MDASNWSVIAVAIISLLGAVLSGRAAKKATKITTEASIANSKLLAETEAYNRARKMDVETIEHKTNQIKEIKAEHAETIRQIKTNNEELRAKVRELKKDNERLHQENISLRERVTRLEQREYSG